MQGPKKKLDMAPRILIPAPALPGFNGNSFADWGSRIVRERNYWCQLSIRN
ncbi:hypothetical protein D1AOALGA4SA_8398 [Olavius algarvensis Delta 1 endosymbiont]|nr:hypothetical protein D1AOALGA4SA_8398 [Olavius algarvensis Delta 1 endosymbiont]